MSFPSYIVMCLSREAPHPGGRTAEEVAAWAQALLTFSLLSAGIAPAIESPVCPSGMGSTSGTGGLGRRQAHQKFLK